MRNILESERLILRKFNLDDIKEILKIFGDKEINKFLPWLPIKNLDEAMEFFKNRYEDSSDYKYAICLKEDNIPIGYVNISSNNSYDLGYGLLKEYWGKGIVLEACRILVENIKDKIPYITATHDRENIKSGHVMKRLGMKYCYSYEENWQPKNKMVVFRMYQLNFKDENFIYKKYWNMYSNHFIERIEKKENNLKIRKYKSSDCQEITELFYNTVHSINKKDYTQEQLDVWATKNIDIEKWDTSFSKNYTVVVESNGIIVGFGDITEDGYLDRLYVHKDFQRMGIATMICDELENKVKGKKIYTHVSITAKPFFIKRGYKVIKQQLVEREGILLENYVMEKR